MDRLPRTRRRVANQRPPQVGKIALSSPSADSGRPTTSSSYKSAIVQQPSEAATAPPLGDTGPQRTAKMWTSCAHWVDSLPDIWQSPTASPTPPQTRKRSGQHCAANAEAAQPAEAVAVGGKRRRRLIAPGVGDAGAGKIAQQQQQPGEQQQPQQPHHKAHIIQSLASTVSSPLSSFTPPPALQLRSILISTANCNATTTHKSPRSGAATKCVSFAHDASVVYAGCSQEPGLLADQLPLLVPTVQHDGATARSDTTGKRVRFNGTPEVCGKHRCPRGRKRLSRLSPDTCKRLAAMRSAISHDNKCAQLSTPPPPSQRRPQDAIVSSSSAEATADRRQPMIQVPKVTSTSTGGQQQCRFKVVFNIGTVNLETLQTMMR